MECNFASSAVFIIFWIIVIKVFTNCEWFFAYSTSNTGGTASIIIFHFEFSWSFWEQTSPYFIELNECCLSKIFPKIFFAILFSDRQSLSCGQTSASAAISVINIAYVYFDLQIFWYIHSGKGNGEWHLWMNSFLFFIKSKCVIFLVCLFWCAFRFWSALKISLYCSNHGLIPVYKMYFLQILKWIAPAEWHRSFKILFYTFIPWDRKYTYNK